MGGRDEGEVLGMGGAGIGYEDGVVTTPLSKFTEGRKTAD